MPKIPIYLVTGFLGSGKTTFLREVINYFSDKQRIAVVQNEFAPANFDGGELKRQTSNNFDLLEINNGSVFCVCLLSGFIESLEKFVLQYSPDIILLEASGLSDPIAVGQIFSAPELRDNMYLKGTIAIVDAHNFGKFDKLLPRIKHQIMIADTIIINKTDLNVNYTNILPNIREISPFGKIYPSIYQYQSSRRRCPF